MAQNGYARCVNEGARGAVNTWLRPLTFVFHRNLRSETVWRQIITFMAQGWQVKKRGAERAPANLCFGGL